MVIRNPSDIVSLLTSIRNKRQEHFGIILLDGGHNVISKKVLFIGSDNSTCVYTRIIFWYACEKKANSIMLFHNHPSGNDKPSLEDIQTTRQIEKACEIMGMQLIDHIIITKYSYSSFAEQGLLHQSNNTVKSVAE